MSKQKILVLGASGGVGQWVTKFAAEQGHQVTALVRPSTRYTAPEGVKVITADVMDAEVLKQAVQGHDAVISALGIMRTSPNNPWSPLASPEDFTARVTSHLIPAMKEHSVGRLVAISAAGVAESEKQISLMMRLIVKSSNIRKAFADFAVMENQMERSGLDTLAVRPVGLVEKDSKRTGIVDKFKMSNQIAKQDVARWMVNAIGRKGRFSQRSEMIGWQ